MATTIHESLIAGAPKYALDHVEAKMLSDVRGHLSSWAVGPVRYCSPLVSIIGVVTCVYRTRRATGLSDICLHVIGF